MQVLPTLQEKAPTQMRVVCGKPTDGKRYIQHGTILYPLYDADIIVYT